MAFLTARTNTDGRPGATCTSVVPANWVVWSRCGATQSRTLSMARLASLSSRDQDSLRINAESTLGPASTTTSSA